MKHISIKTGLVIITATCLFSLSCRKFLKEEVYTQYDPNVFLLNQSGVDALLTGAYSAINITGFNMRDIYSILGEFPTDVAWETGGGLNAQVVPIIQFNWDPNTGFFNGQYNNFYSAIARANNVLSVSESLSGVSQETIDKIQAEAKFIRGFSYYMLHNFFGPTPIIEIPKGASLDEIEQIGKKTPRATEQEYLAYVEKDLRFAADKLKAGGVSSRANKGNALALLTKFYLNSKQWQKCADAALEVMGMGYTLYPDYYNLFSVNGENNKEYIFRFECLLGSTQTNVYMPHTFPLNYRIQPNWINFGAKFRTYTAFYETYEPQDLRRTLFITKYLEINKTDSTLLNRDLQGRPLNAVASFKYLPDPNAIGQDNGNDIPYIRLSDMMLSRAEALNELSGPNQPAVDLIMQVRNRAKASPIALSNFATKDSLRSFILAERGREFVSEGLRREDLVRHGKFIQQARDRNIPAKDYQVLYPLPRAQLDNNPKLVQNAGY